MPRIAHEKVRPAPPGPTVLGDDPFPRRKQRAPQQVGALAQPSRAPDRLDVEGASWSQLTVANLPIEPRCGWELEQLSLPRARGDETKTGAKRLHGLNLLRQLRGIAPHIWSPPLDCACEVAYRLRLIRATLRRM